MFPVRTLFAPASGPVLRSWRLTRVQTATCRSEGEEVPAEVLAQIQVCQNAADLADRPGDPPASRAELRSLLAPPYRGRRFVHLAHDHYGRLLGFARLGVYSAFHHELAHGALTVHPAARRHGVGSALVGALAASAKANGRGRLVLDGPRNAATDGFARSWGLTVGGCDLRSRLDLNSAALHAKLAAVLPMQRHGADGNLLPMRWAGACPEYLLDALIETLDSLHADPDDPAVTPFTEAEVRHREHSAWSAGLREYTACLLDPATGRMAALSTAHTADGMRGEQNETVVAQEYRSRGLAIRVKAYLVSELLTAEPNLRVLDTYNAVGNARILAVNRSLGFEPVDTHAAWTMAL
jgi:GNAT superfamily N-acetyltransferase